MYVTDFLSNKNLKKYTNNLMYIKQQTVDNTKSSAYIFNLFNDAVSNSEHRINRMTLKFIWMNVGVENVA